MIDRAHTWLSVAVLVQWYEPNRSRQARQAGQGLDDREQKCDASWQCNAAHGFAQACTLCWCFRVMTTELGSFSVCMQTAPKAAPPETQSTAATAPHRAEVKMESRATCKTPTSGTDSHLHAHTQPLMHRDKHAHSLLLLMANHQWTLLLQMNLFGDYWTVFRLCIAVWLCRPMRDPQVLPHEGQGGTAQEMGGALHHVGVSVHAAGFSSLWPAPQDDWFSGGRWSSKCGSAARDSSAGGLIFHFFRRNFRWFLKCFFWLPADLWPSKSCP